MDPVKLPLTSFPSWVPPPAQLRANGAGGSEGAPTAERQYPPYQQVPSCLAEYCCSVTPDWALAQYLAVGEAQWVYQEDYASYLEKWAKTCGPELRHSFLCGYWTLLSPHVVRGRDQLSTALSRVAVQNLKNWFELIREEARGDCVGAATKFHSLVTWLHEWRELDDDLFKAILARLHGGWWDALKPLAADRDRAIGDLYAELIRRDLSGDRDLIRALYLKGDLCLRITVPWQALAALLALSGSEALSAQDHAAIEVVLNYGTAVETLTTWAKGMQAERAPLPESASLRLLEPLSPRRVPPELWEHVLGSISLALHCANDDLARLAQSYWPPKKQDALRTAAEEFLTAWRELISSGLHRHMRDPIKRMEYVDRLRVVLAQWKATGLISRAKLATAPLMPLIVEVAKECALTGHMEPAQRLFAAEDPIAASELPSDRDNLIARLDKLVGTSSRGETKLTALGRDHREQIESSVASAATPPAPQSVALSVVEEPKAGISKTGSKEQQSLVESPKEVVAAEASAQTNVSPLNTLGQNDLRQVGSPIMEQKKVALSEKSPRRSAPDTASRRRRELAWRNVKARRSVSARPSLNATHADPSPPVDNFAPPAIVPSEESLQPPSSESEASKPIMHVKRDEPVSWATAVSKRDRERVAQLLSENPTSWSRDLDADDRCGAAHWLVETFPSEMLTPVLKDLTFLVDGLKDKVRRKRSAARGCQLTLLKACAAAKEPPPNSLLQTLHGEGPGPLKQLPADQQKPFLDYLLAHCSSTAEPILVELAFSLLPAQNVPAEIADRLVLALPPLARSHCTNGSLEKPLHQLFASATLHNPQIKAGLQKFLQTCSDDTLAFSCLGALDGRESELLDTDWTRTLCARLVRSPTCPPDLKKRVIKRMERTEDRALINGSLQIPLCIFAIETAAACLIDEELGLEWTKTATYCTCNDVGELTQALQHYKIELLVQAGKRLHPLVSLEPSMVKSVVAVISHFLAEQLPKQTALLPREGVGLIVDHLMEREKGSGPQVLLKAVQKGHLPTTDVYLEYVAALLGSLGGIDNEDRLKQAVGCLTAVFQWVRGADLRIEALLCTCLSHASRIQDPIRRRVYVKQLIYSEHGARHPKVRLSPAERKELYKQCVKVLAVHNLPGAVREGEFFISLIRSLGQPASDEVIGLLELYFDEIAPLLENPPYRPSIATEMAWVLEELGRNYQMPATAQALAVGIKKYLSFAANYTDLDLMHNVGQLLTTGILPIDDKQRFALIKETLAKLPGKPEESSKRLILWGTVVQIVFCSEGEEVEDNFSQILRDHPQGNADCGAAYSLMATLTNSQFRPPLGPEPTTGDHLVIAAQALTCWSYWGARQVGNLSEPTILAIGKGVGAFRNHVKAHPRLAGSPLLKTLLDRMSVSCAAVYCAPKAGKASKRQAEYVQKAKEALLSALKNLGEESSFNERQLLMDLFIHLGAAHCRASDDSESMQKMIELFGCAGPKLRALDPFSYWDHCSAVFQVFGGIYQLSEAKLIKLRQLWKSLDKLLPDAEQRQMLEESLPQELMNKLKK
jgi:hypothetical protein